MLPALAPDQAPAQAVLGRIAPHQQIPPAFHDEMGDAAVGILTGWADWYRVTWPDGSVGFATLPDDETRAQRLRHLYVIARHELEAAAMAAPQPETH